MKRKPFSRDPARVIAGTMGLPAVEVSQQAGLKSLPLALYHIRRGYLHVHRWENRILVSAENAKTFIEAR